MNLEIKNILIETTSELRRLRRQNEVLQARVSMFDDLMLVLRTKTPETHYGASEDVCYQADEMIAELKAAEHKERSEKHANRNEAAGSLVLGRSLMAKERGDKK